MTEDRQLSWQELDSRAEALARIVYQHLKASQSQEPIGFLFPNGWQFIVTYLAILKLGHIGFPMDPTFKALEQGAIIEQIKPRLIITNADYLSSLQGHGAKVLSFDEISKQKPTQDYQSQRLSAKKQIASLVFTSGTTGKPKAATYSHANHIWNIKACSEVWDWDDNDTLLISLPLSHWYGLVMGLAGILYHGNTLYLHDWFDEEKTLKTLASGQISIFTHISTVYFKLLEVKSDYDISKVRLLISGGAALPPDIWQQFKDRFSQEILECYGSSETGRIASNLLKERIPGSPGRILKDVQQKFDKHGQILIKSPGLFPGYYLNQEATDAGFTDDGWWRTGDLGEIQNGRIVLKGRVQERIRRFGYSLSPRDIEWALQENPKIKEIYVMGIQKQNQPNDQLVYFVAGRLTESEIQDYAKLNLPYAWRPDHIIMVDSIPRTRNGKPKISQLKSLTPSQ